MVDCLRTEFASKRLRSWLSADLLQPQDLVAYGPHLLQLLHVPRQLAACLCAKHGRALSGAFVVVLDHSPTEGTSMEPRIPTIRRIINVQQQQQQHLGHKRAARQQEDQQGPDANEYHLVLEDERHVGLDDIFDQPVSQLQPHLLCTMLYEYADFLECQQRNRDGLRRQAVFEAAAELRVALRKALPAPDPLSQHSHKRHSTDGAASGAGVAVLPARNTPLQDQLPPHLQHLQRHVANQQQQQPVTSSAQLAPSAPAAPQSHPVPWHTPPDLPDSELHWLQQQVAALPPFSRTQLVKARNAWRSLLESGGLQARGRLTTAGRDAGHAQPDPVNSAAVRAALAPPPQASENATRKRTSAEVGSQPEHHQPAGSKHARAGSRESPDRGQDGDGRMEGNGNAKGHGAGHGSERRHSPAGGREARSRGRSRSRSRGRPGSGRDSSRDRQRERNRSRERERQTRDRSRERERGRRDSSRERDRRGTDRYSDRGIRYTGGRSYRDDRGRGRTRSRSRGRQGSRSRDRQGRDNSRERKGSDRSREDYRATTSRGSSGVGRQHSHYSSREQSQKDPPPARRGSSTSLHQAVAHNEDGQVQAAAAEEQVPASTDSELPADVVQEVQSHVHLPQQQALVSEADGEPQAAEPDGSAHAMGPGTASSEAVVDGPTAVGRVAGAVKEDAGPTPSVDVLTQGLDDPLTPQELHEYAFSARDELEASLRFTQVKAIQRLQDTYPLPMTLAVFESNQAFKPSPVVLQECGSLVGVFACPLSAPIFDLDSRHISLKDEYQSYVRRATIESRRQGPQPHAQRPAGQHAMPVRPMMPALQPMPGPALHPMVPRPAMPGPMGMVPLPMAMPIHNPLMPMGGPFPGMGPPQHMGHHPPVIPMGAVPLPTMPVPAATRPVAARPHQQVPMPNMPKPAQPAPSAQAKPGATTAGAKQQQQQPQQSTKQPAGAPAVVLSIRATSPDKTPPSQAKGAAGTVALDTATAPNSAAGASSVATSPSTAGPPPLPSDAKPRAEGPPPAAQAGAPPSFVSSTEPQAGHQQQAAAPEPNQQEAKQVARGSGHQGDNQQGEEQEPMESKQQEQQEEKEQEEDGLELPPLAERPLPKFTRQLLLYLHHFKGAPLQEVQESLPWPEDAPITWAKYLFIHRDLVQVDEVEPRSASQQHTPKWRQPKVRAASFIRPGVPMSLAHKFAAEKEQPKDEQRRERWLVLTEKGKEHARELYESQPGNKPVQRAETPGSGAVSAFAAQTGAASSAASTAPPLPATPGTAYGHRAPYSIAARQPLAQQSVTPWQASPAEPSNQLSQLLSNLSVLLPATSAQPQQRSAVPPVPVSPAAQSSAPPLPATVPPALPAPPQGPIAFSGAVLASLTAALNQRQLSATQQEHPANEVPLPQQTSEGEGGDRKHAPLPPHPGYRKGLRVTLPPPPAPTASQPPLPSYPSNALVVPVPGAPAVPVITFQVPLPNLHHAPQQPLSATPQTSIAAAASASAVAAAMAAATSAGFQSLGAVASQPPLPGLGQPSLPAGGPPQPHLPPGAPGGSVEETGGSLEADEDYQRGLQDPMDLDHDDPDFQLGLEVADRPGGIDHQPRTGIDYHQHPDFQRGLEEDLAAYDAQMEQQMGGAALQQSIVFSTGQAEAAAGTAGAGGQAGSLQEQQQGWDTEQGAAGRGGVEACGAGEEENEEEEEDDEERSRAEALGYQL